MGGHIITIIGIANAIVISIIIILVVSGLGSRWAMEDLKMENHPNLTDKMIFPFSDSFSGVQKIPF